MKKVLYASLLIASKRNPDRTAAAYNADNWEKVDCQPDTPIEEAVDSSFLIDRTDSRFARIAGMTKSPFPIEYVRLDCYDKPLEVYCWRKQ